jgi:DNA-binding transcriptional LysR family regulator
MVHIADANSHDARRRGAVAETWPDALPAASTRVKNLEESIGTKLLYRTSQGVTLTPPGQAFVHHARLVLGQIEHLRGDLQRIAKGIKGHVRVFANTTALGEFLPPVLRDYLRSHPDVNIDLRERLSHDIVRAVTEGQTDIGIVAGAVRTENLETLPYRQDRWCWWCRAATRWTAGADRWPLPTRWTWTMWACTRPAPSMPSCARPATSCTGCCPRASRSATSRPPAA